MTQEEIRKELSQLRGDYERYKTLSREILLETIKTFKKKYGKNTIYFSADNGAPEGHASTGWGDYDNEVMLMSITEQKDSEGNTLIKGEMMERETCDRFTVDICDKYNTFSYSDIDLCDITEEILSQIKNGKIKKGEQ